MESQGGQETQTLSDNLVPALSANLARGVSSAPPSIGSAGGIASDLPEVTRSRNSLTTAIARSRAIMARETAEL